LRACTPLFGSLSWRVGGGGGAARPLAVSPAPAEPFSATGVGGGPNIIAFFGTGLGEHATDVDGNVSASVDAKLGTDPASPPGIPATVLYAGRAPGFVGLNQINVMLPMGIAPGIYRIFIRRNGVQSNLVTITIR